ncbi:MAG: oligopeptide transporter, OPT family [Turicibacter sp.]|nr:oligopeptide transporter, OPT family [Turicibacter sp.]
MDKKLPKEAYGGCEGQDYAPYVQGAKEGGGNGAVMLVGILLAVVFAASTAYSGMKSGLTVAAGIPGSIIGSALVSATARKKGIFGKNLVQGMASGGESIASGIIFVLPAIILIGTNFSFWEGALVSAAGVLFGIGVTSLVQKYLMVQEHGKLMYPESMAISETLVAGEVGGAAMKYMGIGFALGGVLTAISSGIFNWFNNVVSYTGRAAYRWRFELEVNPLLVGIGFIVGMETSLTMFAGSILSYFGIIPLIAYFAEMAGPEAFMWNNSGNLINAMDFGTISGSYVRYIGAGMMLCGGIIGAIRLIPTIVSSVRETVGAKSAENSPLGMVFIGVGAILGFIMAFLFTRSFPMALLGGILTLIFSLLFAIVSGRLTGTVGTSNLPVSGMTIAALVVVTLIFVGMSWTSLEANRSLLLFGTFIVVAVSTAGGYCQSQKVTFILGGNKNEMLRFFSVAALVGVLTVVGTIMILHAELQNTVDPQFALPQANLMATLTSGIMQGNLPSVMIIVGVVMALVCFLLKLPIMTVAIGFYLPIATTSIILVGALIRAFVEHTTKDKRLLESKVANGVSLSSGLVAGGSIIGLLGIILQLSGVLHAGAPSGFFSGNFMAIILLAALVLCTLIPIQNSRH